MCRSCAAGSTVASEPLHHLLDLLCRQPGHREEGDVRPATPGGHKRGSTCQEGQERCGRTLRHHEAQPFQGGGIAPVQVFHQEEHRLPRGEP